MLNTGKLFCAILHLFSLKFTIYWNDWDTRITAWPKGQKKAGWFSLSESHPAPACNDTQDSHRGSRPGILYATSFIPLKNKYRFRFLLLDTCFLFFCSLYSVLLDFLYLYGLFIFTFHYQVHFNDKCSRSLIIYSVFENITGLVLYQFPFEHFIRQIPYSLFSIIIIWLYGKRKITFRWSVPPFLDFVLFDSFSILKRKLFVNTFLLIFKF